MTKTLSAIAGICILAVGIASVNALSPTCTSMCFSLTDNTATKGYDPEFLKQAIVLETCQESHKDLSDVGMKDLGYCSKELGTL